MSGKTGTNSASGGLLNLSIKGKVIAYGALVTLLLVVVGGLGFVGVSRMNRSTERVTHSASVVDAVMAMKTSVARDKRLIMELLASVDANDLAGNWTEHLKANANFQNYSEAIINGGKVAGEQVFATSDPRLKSIVEASRKFHTDQFASRIDRIHTLKQQAFALTADNDKALADFESAFRSVEGLTGRFEEAVRRRIADRVRGGESARALVDTESVWADAANELKYDLAQMRIQVERYGQELTDAQREQVKQKFQADAKSVAAWIDALQSGGRIDGNRVPQVSGSGMTRTLGDIAQQYQKGTSINPSSTA